MCFTLSKQSNPFYRKLRKSEHGWVVNCVVVVRPQRLAYTWPFSAPLYNEPKVIQAYQGYKILNRSFQARAAAIYSMNHSMYLIAMFMSTVMSKSKKDFDWRQ